MKIFLLRSVVNDAVTPHQLIKLDITKKKVFYHNLLLSCQLDQKLCFPLWELVVVKKIKLIDQCVSMVKTIVLKLQERTPLKYLIVHCSSCLVPRTMVNESESVLLQINKVVDSYLNISNYIIRRLMKLNYNLKSLLPIMFHDIPISLTVLMYPCNISINFMVNFFTKISSTNPCGKFLFSFLPCHTGKAKLKEVLV